MNDVQYLEIEEVIAIQQHLLDLHGGKPGFNGPAGQGLIESALNRPINKALYEGADLLAQAAALYFGLAKNHGFSDGNKRVAVTVTDIFLQLNGWEFTCDNDTLATFTERCSDEDWTEDAVEAFVRRHAARLPEG